MTLGLEKLSATGLTSTPIHSAGARSGAFVRRLLFLTVTSGFICANAATINFSALSQAGSGSTSEGNTYTQQGFVFADQLNGAGNGFSVWQASSPNLPGLSTANTSLFEFFAGSTTLLTETGNVAFTFNSIDLAQYNDLQSAGTFNVTFIGTHPDLSTVTQTVTVNRFAGTPVLQTFNLVGFTNVVSVSFTQGVAASGSAYQFDNLVIDAASVPEPGSITLVGAGLAALGLRLRRVKR
jgi:hypothetical protein